MDGESTSKTSVNSGGRIKSSLAWLTGILLVIPALINAGLDAYNSIMDIPVGSVEKLNNKKRSEHFQEEPLFYRELEIAEKNAKKILKLFVYPNADIYVNYSGYQQWLPSEDMDFNSSSINIISLAYASDARSVFGAPNAVVLPSRGPGKTIDLESLQTIKIDASQKYDQTITRSYWFEETNTTHRGFSPSKRIYERRFSAVEGYKITSYKVDVASINNARIISKNLSEDGKSVSVQFSISSGPVLNRWRGWIKAQIITEQIKL